MLFEIIYTVAKYETFLKEGTFVRPANKRPIEMK